ncbi:MAG: hypothetical protein E6Q97_01180 [Desulfurellales bacterium]|nr:MAG: hypothetical protein E6Q97_01180 [Desulfurellales bacterium]
MNDASFWTELGKSGPWAMVAGILLYTVITAWKQDREKLLPFFNTLNETLILFKAAVDANTKSNETVARGQGEMLDLLKEIRSDGRDSRASR